MIKSVGGQWSWIGY